MLRHLTSGQLACIGLLRQATVEAERLYHRKQPPGQTAFPIDLDNGRIALFLFSRRACGASRRHPCSDELDR